MRVIQILLLVLAVCTNTQTLPDRGSHDDKVFGGTRVAEMREGPYVIQIQMRRRSNDTAWRRSCGGTIVSPLWVVTACHCLFDRFWVKGKYVLQVVVSQMDLWDVIAGSANTGGDIHDPQSSQLAKTAQIRKPQKLLHHPQCGQLLQAILGYDFGLIKLAKPFEKSKFVRPVGMILDKDVLNRELNHLSELQRRHQLRCTLSGWGRTVYQSIPEAQGFKPPPGFSTPTPGPPEDLHLLKRINLTHLTSDVEECVRMIMTAFREEAPFIPAASLKGLEDYYRNNLVGYTCALGENKGGHSVSSACQGDSGGGLICKGTQKKHIFGVDSWAIGCGTSAPFGFQSMEPVLDWMKSEVCNVTDCQDVTYLDRQCERPSRKTKEQLCGSRPRSSRRTTKRRTPRVPYAKSARQNSGFPFLVMVLLIHLS